MSAVVPYLIGFYAAVSLFVGFCVLVNASEDGAWTWLAAGMMVLFWPGLALWDIVSRKAGLQ